MADAGAEQNYLAAEARARVEIDRMLEAAGWAVQRKDAVNLGAARGVAVREFTMIDGHGRADYLLFVDRKAVGVIEAKPAGAVLANVEPQAQMYASGLPDNVHAPIRPLPFVYVSTGNETGFWNHLDPEYRRRRVFWFHRPETLAEWTTRWGEDTTQATLRARLLRMPPPYLGDLWPPKDVAVKNLERSLREFRPRALIQMATGSGKTKLAAFIAYRLIRHADARRVLFLVDRANLGLQTLTEFQKFATPDDGRKLTELYNVQLLGGNAIDPVARVSITTIQRLYSILKGELELAEELDELSGFEAEPSAPVEVAYNSVVPIETFDVIIVDEAHRSIYGVWRQVLDYFDAFVIGLTATPGKQTFAFFNQNMVMEYPYEQAVADGINVDFDVYRIRTEISEQGSTVEAGLVTKFRDRETRAERLEKLDADFDYEAKELDKKVVARDQIRTIIHTFRERLFTEIFPGRTEVPKTLIFAKSDAHADDIVDIVREEFGKGNQFAAKITYRSKAQGNKPEELLSSFRNSYFPRVAVTVDMIATGTDVKPLECVFFMRTVKSRNYFEQMRGRGTRVIKDTDLQAVTPDARHKDRFVLIDAVGVTETDLIDVTPVDRRRTVSLEKLLTQVAFGDRDHDVVASIAGRLARLDARLTTTERHALHELAGTSISELAHGIFDALDADNQRDVARVQLNTDVPSDEQVAVVATQLIDEALAPFDHADLRRALVNVHRTHEQVIDETSADTVIEVGYSQDATDRARRTVESFREFIAEHKDEITALQILYSQPYGARQLTFVQIKELADAINLPPRRWTPEALWSAYETLERNKVHGSTKTVLTNLVSLVRHALGKEDMLIAFPDQVADRYSTWLRHQEQAGRRFTPEQLQWLDRIREHIGDSLRITAEDFEYTPFAEHGGIGRAHAVFGDELTELLNELNQELVA